MAGDQIAHSMMLVGDISCVCSLCIIVIWFSHSTVMNIHDRGAGLWVSVGRDWFLCQIRAKHCGHKYVSSRWWKLYQIMAATGCNNTPCFFTYKHNCKCPHILYILSVAADCIDTLKAYLLQQRLWIIPHRSKGHFLHLGTRWSQDVPVALCVLPSLWWWWAWGPKYPASFSRQGWQKDYRWQQQTRDFLGQTGGQREEGEERKQGGGGEYVSNISAQTAEWITLSLNFTHYLGGQRLVCEHHLCPTWQKLLGDWKKRQKQT